MQSKEIVGEPTIVELTNPKGKTLDAVKNLIAVKLKEPNKYTAYTRDFTQENTEEVTAKILLIRRHTAETDSNISKGPFVTITEVFHTPDSEVYTGPGKLYVAFHKYRYSDKDSHSYEETTVEYQMPDKVLKVVEDVVKHLEATRPKLTLVRWVKLN
jgi:hypothetical protein